MEMGPNISGFYLAKATRGVRNGFTEQVDEIRRVQKNGEMATVEWFEIVKDGEVIAEIKESVCNVLY